MRNWFESCCIIAIPGISLVWAVELKGNMHTNKVNRYFFITFGFNLMQNYSGKSK